MARCTDHGAKPVTATEGLRGGFAGQSCERSMSYVRALVPSIGVVGRVEGDRLGHVGIDVVEGNDVACDDGGLEGKVLDIGIRSHLLLNAESGVASAQ